MKIIVVVPAYNESTTIAEVLVKLKEHPWDILVVDDGSHDNTKEVAHSFGVTVLRHVVNRGLGAALRTGFAYAIANDYECVITLDADGQHNPHEIPLFVSAIEQGADVVIGKRYLRDMPKIRQAYNTVGAVITSSLFGAPLTDSQSGFRAFRTVSLKNFSLTTSRMEISSEIVGEAYRVGAKIVQVPISVRYTNYSLSKGQSFFEGIRTLWGLILKSFN